MEDNYMEEISLRELIEVLIRGKMVILGITLAAVLTSAIFSFFIIQPTYEASITLMVSPPTKLEIENSDEDKSGFLNIKYDFPVMTLAAYKEQIKNPVILQNVIDELELDPEEYTKSSLSQSISIETIENSNFIKIKVRNRDPKLAALIANSMGSNFIEFASEKEKEQTYELYQLIEEQMNIQKDKLDQALVKYKEFLARSRSAEELKAEVDSKLKLLTEYKTQYVQKEVEESTKKAALETAQKELEATERVLVTYKSLSEDAFLNNAVSDATGKDALSTGQLTMESQEINPNYISLQNRISSLKIELNALNSEKQNIKQQIERNSGELEVLQAELAEKQHQEQLLLQSVNLAQQTYDAFLRKYEETRIAQSSQVGDASIVIVSPAMEPLKPVSPKKALNIAIAGVLGVMVSVFIVFFKEYWESTSTTQGVKESV